ncbi:hypothetical protein [Arcobacter sp.]|uniref:hypothetical protein n=1 Tax=Arcobacter sp. TaxID=1872629 RepID=UPI003D0D2CFF
MRRNRIIIGLIFMLMSITFASASPESCRESLGVDTKYFKNDFYNTEVYLLIDKSTYFSQKDKKTVLEKITPFIKQNTKINVYSFTEYGKNSKNENFGSFYIYSDLTSSEEDDISRSKVNKLKHCLKEAKAFAYEGIKNGLEKGTRKKEDNVLKSEILRNLKIYSKNNIRYSKAKRKVVILMSDMLENSKHISFYKNGIVKLLDINKELAFVKKQNLLSAFNDSEVYVYGLGSIEVNSSKEDSRDSDILDNLADFWDEYFVSSGAKPRGLRSYNMDYSLEY